MHTRRLLPSPCAAHRPPDGGPAGAGRRRRRRSAAPDLPARLATCRASFCLTERQPTTSPCRCSPPPLLLPRRSPAAARAGGGDLPGRGRLGVLPMPEPMGVLARASDCGGGAGPAPAGVNDFLKSLEATRQVDCTAAAWRFLGISLAGYKRPDRAGAGRARRQRRVAGLAPRLTARFRLADRNETLDVILVLVFDEPGMTQRDVGCRSIGTTAQTGARVSLRLQFNTVGSASSAARRSESRAGSGFGFANLPGLGLGSTLGSIFASRATFAAGGVGDDRAGGDRLVERHRLGRGDELNRARRLRSSCAEQTAHTVAKPRLAIVREGEVGTQGHVRLLRND